MRIAIKVIHRSIALILLAIFPASCSGIGAQPVQTEVKITIEGTASEASVSMFGAENMKAEVKSLPYSTTVSVEDGDRLYVKAKNDSESGVISVSIRTATYYDEDIGFPPESGASISYRPGIK